MKFWKVSLLLAIEVLVIILAIPGSYAEKVVEKEVDLIYNHAGIETAQYVQSKGIAWKNKLFFESGFYSAAYQVLIPSEEEKNKSRGLENLGGLWFEYASGRLDALEDVVQMAANRAALALAWAPYILILFIPALLDGYYTRRIRQTSFAYVSPIVHTYAVKLIMAIVFGGGILFLMPIPMTPVMVPVGLMVISICIGIAFSNFQKRL